LIPFNDGFDIAFGLKGEGLPEDGQINQSSGVFSVKSVLRIGDESVPTELGFHKCSDEDFLYAEDDSYTKRAVTENPHMNCLDKTELKIFGDSYTDEESYL
jgi:hypothetical protein